MELEKMVGWQPARAELLRMMHEHEGWPPPEDVLRGDYAELSDLSESTTKFMLAALPIEALVAEERERCARVAFGQKPLDVHEESPLYGMGHPRTDFDRGIARGREQAAAAIRESKGEAA